MVKKGICFLLASGFADKCANVPTWAEWSEWSECSATCGEGYQIRRQRCYKNCYVTAIENCEGERPTEQKESEDLTNCKNCNFNGICPSQTFLMRTLLLGSSPYLDK